MPAGEKFQRYLDMNGYHHFEGESGVRRLKTLVKDIGGYSNLGEFLADNSGACEAIVNFVQEWTERNTEWQDRLDAMVDSDEADDNRDADADEEEEG